MNEIEKLVRRLKTARDAHLSNVAGKHPGDTVALASNDVRAHVTLLQEVIHRLDVKPAGYTYSLARARFMDGSGYCEWGPPQFGRVPPIVPEGAARDITPLWDLAL